MQFEPFTNTEKLTIIMLQDVSTIEYKHKKFIERAVKFNNVWGLESEEGYATASSNDFDGADVIPFWSDRAYANAAAKDAWKHYEPTSMPLADFIENWLVGMHNDGLVVGTNWDANLFGKEIEPLELAVEIADELIMRSSGIVLKKYKDTKDFQKQVRRALGIDEASR